ncbi:hypothetical protein [Paraprevotella xylaniphila]|uniref:hypothetical protein n=1 Tax=Paraprevotella xylaniphila TaxID=454155 RepID=UPI0039F4B0A5
MMERMNYSRLNMAGLGTTRANSSGIIGRGDPYELVGNALLLEKGKAWLWADGSPVMMAEVTRRTVRKQLRHK